MAPVIHELDKYPEQIDSVVVVTAQHRQMLDQVLDIFKVQPDYDLDLMQHRQTPVEVMSRALTGLDKLIQELTPDIVLVHGDTATTFIASLAAFHNRVAVGHVEAGLRTYNKYSPFPEEMNRQLTGVLADLHFAPTDQAAGHLLQENKAEEKIYITGNTEIDALNITYNQTYTHPILEQVQGSRLLLMTAHRRENLGEPMQQMFTAARRVVDDFPDTQLVYPVHLNPAVQEVAQAILGNHERIHLIEPLGVYDFHNFAARAHLILTDSGGVQEAAPSLGVPVLVLRDTTERPEGIAAGTLKLAGTEEETIYRLASGLLKDEAEYKAMAQAKNPYGDGRASERIVKAILHHFGQGPKPDSFKVI